MFRIIANIFSWIVQALTDVIALVTSIPKYISHFTFTINRLMPPWALPYIGVMIAVSVIYGIKRAVL